MRAVRNVGITCPKCSQVFPSPLKFETLSALLSAVRVGFPAQCSGCYHLFEVERGQISLELEPKACTK